MQLRTSGVRWMTVSLAAAAALVVAGCEKGAPPAQSAMPPASVTTAIAGTKDVPIYLDEIGKTLAVESVTIIPQVGGKVIAAHVTDGSYVKKGDLLFEIDPREYAAAVASADATLQQRQADAELAKLEFKRVEGMIDKAAISQIEFDQKRIAVLTSAAQVAAASAALETAKLNLEYAKIYSPMDGRAGARLVDPGNVVKENEGSMLVIQKLDPIYAEFTVTENELGTVRKFMAANGYTWGEEREKGLRVLVDIPGDDKRVMQAMAPIAAGHVAPDPTTQPSTVPANAGAREGKLTFLDNAVQNGMGTVRLRATVPNADRYFWPGQFVTARLILTVKKDAVLVPVQAQQIGQQGPFVYVVKADNTAEIRPIVAGQRQGEMIVIDSGVQAGDNVIITGQMMVQPGAKVAVANAPAAGTPAPAASAVPTTSPVVQAEAQ